MKFEIFFISFINFITLITCLEVQLNVHETNGSIHNYTIINNTNSKSDLFQAKKIFENKCQCNYNTDVFYVSPNKNTINFTINTSVPGTTLNIPENKLEEPNLFINSEKMRAEYTLTQNNENENIYIIHKKIHFVKIKTIIITISITKIRIQKQ